MNALAIATFGISSSACLLPPERMGVEERVNFLPEFDRSTQRPRDTRIEMPFDCNSFFVSTRVRDKNDNVLNYRFVANADFDDARLVEESSVDPEIGLDALIRTRIDLALDFPDLHDAANPDNPNGPGTNQVGVLSLFVTDSPSWSIPVEEASANTIGLGEIPPNPTDGGLDPYGVTELRWTFVLLAQFDKGMGECPQ